MNLLYKLTRGVFQRPRFSGRENKQSIDCKAVIGQRDEAEECRLHRFRADGKRNGHRRPLPGGGREKHLGRAAAGGGHCAGAGFAPGPGWAPDGVAARGS